MSYEPTLIIKATDLENKEGLLNKMVYSASNDCYEEDIRVAKFLLFNVLKDSPIEFENTSFYICRPELKSFNSDVREFLDEFDVYYKTYNG